MSEFFYYGQKDTIQRLNELAGRGAVVASYAPKVGMSPLGGANGRITPAWLDPNLPIQSNARICSGPTAKYGYSYLAQGAVTPICIWIARIPEENLGGHENLLIRGILNNNWGASTTSAVNILMGVRGGFHVEWTMDGARVSNSRFIVAKKSDGSYHVYAYFVPTAFASISFDLVGMDAATFAEPVITTTIPDGEIVFDTGQQYGSPGHIPPRYQGAYVEGDTYATIFRGPLFSGTGQLSDSFINSATKPNSSNMAEVLGLGVTGVPGSVYPGRFGFMTTPGQKLYYTDYSLRIRAWDQGSANWSPDLLKVRGDGIVTMPVLKAGNDDLNSRRHHISMGTAMSEEIIYFTRSTDAIPCVAVLASDGTVSWGSSLSVMYVGRNSNTARSINASGTVNTQGNDYAEYVVKAAGCSDVIPGQIIGITSDNKITDQWNDAVMFAIKSTAPSFVGGDSWSACVGPRPTAKAGAAPSRPVRRADEVEQRAVVGSNPVAYEDVVTQPGDSDAEWAEKQTAYANALTAYNIAAQQDANAMAAFDAALEAARQKVDRIAIAGRVPVNVLGAQPGDYIVPVQDGAGIKGIAVHEDELSMKQYLRAVGRVIAIEADGRAYVMVKAV